MQWWVLWLSSASPVCCNKWVHFWFFKSLWRDHCMHLYSTGGWGGGRKGKALGVWRDFKSLQPWKDFGCLRTFKRTVIYCKEKGMLPQFEQWNMFLLKTIANVDHHSIYGGKALTVCYYVLNNFYFRKCILVCNAFEMSLPVLHLPYELW